MYHIIGGDGKEYGPVTAEQLQQWVREGRLNAQTRVRAEGATEWQSLSALPEMAPALNPPPPISTPPAVSPVLDGDYELDISGCIRRAWAVLSANFWLMVGGCAIYLLVVGGLSGMAQIPFIGVLFSI